MAGNPEIDQDPLAKAKEDMAEKVSVAGWKEAFQEKIIWMRRIYQIALVVFSICCIYYSYQVIQNWSHHSGWTDEIEEVGGQEFLPFSNVTICAQVYLNKTYVKENIRIPEKVLHRYIAETGRSIDTLYEQLALFLVQTVRPKLVNNSLLAYFSQIVRQNPALNDFSAFTVAALPKCQDMLKRCWFNGREFDCCDRAVHVLDNDGICYLLALNFDSDNAAFSNKTQNQIEPGPRRGLTVEASTSLKDSLWLDGVVSNGFRVYVSAAPFGDVSSPIGAPHGAETFIKVTPTKHELSTNCAPHGHLSKKDDFMHYDPEGYSCLYANVSATIYKYAACHMFLPLYRPNSSIACNPTIMYGFANLATQEGQNMLDLKVSENDLKKPVWKLVSEMENDLKMAFSDKSKCPSHCSYWSYSSSSSFFYIVNRGGKDLLSDNQETMFSKIHVYYGDFDYRQYTEVKEQKIYLAFCDFGNVVGLYWGMSVVSFVHVFFYVLRYFYVLRKSRKKPKPEKQLKRAKGTRVIRNIRVAPAPQMLETQC